MINRLIFKFRCIPTSVKVLIYVILSIAAIVVIYDVTTWAAIRFFPVAARDQRISHTYLASMFIGRTRARQATEYNLDYFYTTDEAIDAHFFREIARERPPEQNRREMKRFESDGEIFVIFVMDNASPYSHLVFYLFLTDSDMISYPLYFWPQNIAGCSINRRRIYFDEDRIARDIIWSFYAQPVTSRVNNGSPIYYGVGLGVPPAYMSILGYQPDNIMSFTHSGNEYFFWYYLNAPLFTEVYKRYVNVETAEDTNRARFLRHGDVIEIFDIRIVR